MIQGYYYKFNLNIEITENMLYFLSIFNFLFYFILCESIFQTTPGKILTNSIVTDYEGENISFFRVLSRSIVRLIPFEAIAFLFSYNTWHDSISNTLVVDAEFKD